MIEPTWMGFQLPAAAHWQAFHRAFYALYLKHPDRSQLALFTALENRRIVVLPPAAGELVAEHLPRHTLRPCPRPPASMLALELGYPVQRDTGWFELTDAERQMGMAAAGPLIGVPVYA